MRRPDGRNGGLTELAPTVDETAHGCHPREDHGDDRLPQGKPDKGCTPHHDHLNDSLDERVDGQHRSR